MIDFCFNGIDPKSALAQLAEGLPSLAQLTQDIISNNINGNPQYQAILSALVSGSGSGSSSSSSSSDNITSCTPRSSSPSPSSPLSPHSVSSTGTDSEIDESKKESPYSSGDFERTLFESDENVADKGNVKKESLEVHAPRNPASFTKIVRCTIIV